MHALYARKGQMLVVWNALPLSPWGTCLSHIGATPAASWMVCEAVTPAIDDLLYVLCRD